MREIKFRGLDKNGVWHYGFYWEFNNQHFIRSFNGTSLEDFEVSRITICQLTGKKLDNKDLFESDIVEGIYGEQENEKNPLKVIGVVGLESGCFVIDFQGIKTVYLRDISGINGTDVLWRTQQNITRQEWFYQIKNMKIVGNIFENPNLLTKTERN